MFKKIYSLLIICIVIVSCSTTKNISKENNYVEVIGDIKDIENKVIPDKYAMYPNGKKGIYNLIINEIIVPKKALQSNIKGKVLIKYFVGIDGYVENIEVIKSVHPLLDKAAVDVIKKMKKWTPGKKNGKPVRVFYKQPFKF
tara:strand:+ start:180 stop:605 length:426 start_codon:yes stop_codon:yes gene_type:complete